MNPIAKFFTQLVAKLTEKMQRQSTRLETKRQQIENNARRFTTECNMKSKDLEKASAQLTQEAQKYVLLRDACVEALCHLNRLTVAYGKDSAEAKQALQQLQSYQHELEQQNKIYILMQENVTKKIKNLEDFLDKK